MIMEDPNAVNPTPDPAQAPAAPGLEGASGTPAPPVTPGAEGTPAEPGVEDPTKTVPITALHEERDKRQSVQAQLDQIKTLLGDKVTFDSAGIPTLVEAPPAQPADNANYQAQLDKLWEEDPRKAVQAELQMAIDWYDNVNAQVDLQEDAVRKAHPDFDTFRSDVRMYIRKLPPAQRSRQGIVEMAYMVVKGQQVDKIVEDRNKELIRKLQAGESIQGLAGTYSTPATPAGPHAITEDEKKVAAAMNMTPEDYIKYKK
jgi:hypothetical protein